MDEFKYSILIHPSKLCTQYENPASMEKESFGLCRPEYRRSGWEGLE